MEKGWGKERWVSYEATCSSQIRNNTTRTKCPRDGREKQDLTRLCNFPRPYSEHVGYPIKAISPLTPEFILLTA